MQLHRPWLALVVAYTCAFAATAASAEAIGANGADVVLGQPLDYAVQVRLAPGESLSPECVTAQVTLGERLLPASQVRTVVRMVSADLAQVRVLTTRPVDEPVVGVVLTAGCSSHLARRFVVMADPPLAPAPATVDTTAPAYAATTPLVVATGALPTAPRPATATAMVAGAAAAPVAPTGPPQAEPAPRRAHRAEPPHKPPHMPPRKPRPTLRQEAARAAAGGSRLELDAAEPVRRGAAAPVAAALPAPAATAAAIEQALDAVEAAASAARAAAAAASASAARMAELQATVGRLRAQAQAQAQRHSADAVAVRQRLLQAERASRWTWPLLAATGALTLLSAWLGWQLAALQQARRGEWRAAAMPRPDHDDDEAEAERGPGSGRPATAPIPFVTSEMRLPAATAPTPAPRLPLAWPPSSSPELLNPPTVAMDPEPRLQPPPAGGGAGAAALPELASLRTAVQPRPAEAMPRDVSIEELIDLEQQAEFFAVLGQDEAAIDLLVEHLRHTGGSSPLPYLKLLEIHGRRGDRADYERMRSRFNHRFNAYAPEWGVDLQAGRSLADYPGVIPRLEQVWPRPLDAMAELEALLFRKSRGDLFELAAYREVLFLYAIARDLLDREVGEGGAVDLLLPLVAAPLFGNTAPAPYLELTGDDGRPPAAPAEAAGAGELDLDLSLESDRQASIFDTLDESRASDGPPSLR